MANDFTDKTQAFKDWFLSHAGASINPSVDIKDYRPEGRGRGVVALEDIPVDTALFTVDPSSVLSCKTSELFSRLPQSTCIELRNKPWPSLILALIYEYFKREGSHWFRYFQVLPLEDDFDTLIWWDANEIQELQASAIKDKIGRTDAWAMFREEILPVIESHQEVFKDGTLMAASDSLESSERLLRLANRMASTIMAYAFDLESEEKRGTADEDGYITDEEETDQQKAMMPMADMLNADAKFNAHLFNDSDGLIMRSTRNIKAGEEILNDFGTLPRSELLRRYGYVTQNYAKYDVVEIPLDLIMQEVRKSTTWNSTDIAERLSALKEDEIAQDGFVIDRGDPAEMAESNELPEAEIAPELFELLHVMLAEPTVWRKWHKKLDGDGQASLRSRACRMLQSILEQRLQQYSTSEKDDQMILERVGGMPRRQQMAIEVRLGEKSLLREAQSQLAQKNLVPLENSSEPAPKRQKMG